MNVENAPFLITRLKIQVLPCVLAFVDGVSVDRIIGFEGLGYSTDTITPKDVEARLLQAGVLTRAKVLGNRNTNMRLSRSKEHNGSEDDDEWD